MGTRGLPRGHPEIPGCRPGGGKPPLRGPKGGLARKAWPPEAPNNSQITCLIRGNRVFDNGNSWVLLGALGVLLECSWGALGVLLGALGVLMDLRTRQNQPRLEKIMIPGYSIDHSN